VEQEEGERMNRVFYEGRNFAALSEAVAGVTSLEKGLPALILVDGRAGLGKTEACQVYASKNDCVYLRALENWTPRWLLKQLAHELGIEPQGRVSRIFTDCLKALRRRPRPIFVDEADHVARKLNLLETLRDIYDLVGVPVILVGMNEVARKLARHPQFYSRIGRVVEFQPLDAEEIQRLALEWCGLELESNAAERLYKETEEGDFRLVVKALSMLEERVKVNAKPGERLAAGPKMIEMVGRQMARERRAA
jgi:hypothetical protein